MCSHSTPERSRSSTSTTRHQSPCTLCRAAHLQVLPIKQLQRARPAARVSIPHAGGRVIEQRIRPVQVKLACGVLALHAQRCKRWSMPTGARGGASMQRHCCTSGQCKLPAGARLGVCSPQAARRRDSQLTPRLMALSSSVLAHLRTLPERLHLMVPLPPLGGCAGVLRAHGLVQRERLQVLRPEVQHVVVACVGRGGPWRCCFARARCGL